MDSRAFLGLQQTHNPYRWHLPVDLRLCTGGNFLYGGSALGAAISAMEGTTGRNVIWTTAQYLSYARPGEVMDIDVIVPALETIFRASFLPKDIYLISRMPSDPQMADILPVAVISLILAFVATLYPSWRASQVNPAEALRYE